MEKSYRLLETKAPERKRTTAPVGDVRQMKLPLNDYYRDISNFSLHSYIFVIYHFVSSEFELVVEMNCKHIVVR